MTRPDVVFVGHAADRTGPPVALLGLLRTLRRETSLTAEVLLFRGGPLLAEFEALARTRVIGEPADVHDPSLAGRLRVGAHNLWLARATVHLRRARLVYLNTAWTVRLLAHLGPGGPRVVLHVHELDLGIGQLLAPADLERLRRRPHRFVVGTPVARANLVERHGIDPSRVVLRPYFVERPPTVTPTRPAAAGDRVVVGAAGVTNWRKAPDLFVQLASRVMERAAVAPHFVWIGGEAGGSAGLGVPDDVASLGLDGRIEFVGEQADPWSWLAGLDVLVLVSREDTFPLVCLEAGALGVPIVCFDQGGIPALVRAARGGTVVPHLDVEAMADAVVELLRDHAGRRAAGRRLADHVRRNHGPAAASELAALIGELVP